MAENTQRANKVWAAFVKFIRNQTIVNGRLVDTQLIGFFAKNDNGNGVSYWPSPDFLEAGKFKLQRGLGSVVSEEVANSQMNSEYY